jgi:hypothetical protein
LQFVNSVEYVTPSECLNTTWYAVIVDPFGDGAVQVTTMLSPKFEVWGAAGVEGGDAHRIETEEEGKLRPTELRASTLKA